MTIRFTARMNGILNASLTPLLGAQGFRKRGGVYLADQGEVSWLVDVQKSRWNEEDEAQFTINGGVHVPGVVSVYSGRHDPEVPRMLDCCLTVRIGMLDEARLDRWWKLGASDQPEEVKDESLAEEIRNQVQSYLLPFLRKFETAAAVASFLERPVDHGNRFVRPQSSAQRHAYAALIHSKLGDRAKARSGIEQAIREAKGTPIAAIIERLRVTL